MKVYLTLVILAVISIHAFADEHHMLPTETFGEALSAVPSGGTVFIDADVTTYEQKIRVKNRYYTEASPLVVDGQGHTSTQPVDVSDSSWVVIKNLTIYGGIGLNSSTKDYSKVLQHVVFKNCKVLYGRLFAGGYSYHDITILNCTFQEILYKGTETHGIYFSGGHWEGSVGMPHPNNINIIGCTIRFCGGRHGIQVNGCFDNVQIKGNTIYCAAFTAFQGIGIEGCEVSDNTFLLGNRGCLNIYDYWDNFYWSPDGPANIETWRKCHHPNNYWNVHHNTFLVGPKEWCWWQDGSVVKNRPCILINNELAGATFEWPDLGIYNYGIDYEPSVHWIHDNVLSSPWANMIEYHDQYSPWVTQVDGNLMHTYDTSAVPMVCFNKDVLAPGVPLGYSVADIEANYPSVYFGNILGVDPKFKQWPELPHASEIPAYNHLYPPDASYNWADWPGVFDLKSEQALKRGVGRRESLSWAIGKMKKLPAGKMPSVAPVINVKDIGQ